MDIFLIALVACNVVVLLLNILQRDIYGAIREVWKDMNEQDNVIENLIQRIEELEERTNIYDTDE